MQPKKSKNTKVSVKIVPSSLSLPGMCALVSLVVVIVVVVVFRSIALQRAFFLPLSFFLSLSQRKCINPFAKPPSCALIIPLFFLHTPIIHSLPHLHLHRSRQFIRRWKATIWIIWMIAPPISITQIGVSSQQCWGYRSLSSSLSLVIGTINKEKIDSTYGKSTRGILNAKAITSP